MLRALGIPVEMYTVSPSSQTLPAALRSAAVLSPACRRPQVLFAMARTVGWVAQWQEMISEPVPRITRPRQVREARGANLAITSDACMHALHACCAALVTRALLCDGTDAPHACAPSS